MIAVEQVVDEVVVADGEVWVAVDVSIDVDVIFIVACVVEVAGLAVVIFAHGEATKCKERAKRIKKFDALVL